MQIGNIGSIRYRNMIEMMKRLREQGLVKPVKPTDNDGDITDEQIPKKKNREKQTKQ